MFSFHGFIFFQCVREKKLLSVTEQLNCGKDSTAPQHHSFSTSAHYSSTSAAQVPPADYLFYHKLQPLGHDHTQYCFAYLCCEQHMLSFLYWHTYRLWGSSLNLLDHLSSNLVKDFSVFIPILFLQFWVLLVLKTPCEVFQSAKFLFVFSDQNILYVSVMCLYLYMLYCFTAALLGISPLEMSGTLWLTLLKLGDVTEGGRDQKWKNNR